MVEVSGLKFSSRNRKVEIKNTSRERYKGLWPLLNLKA